MNIKHTTQKSVYDSISRNVWMARFFVALLLGIVLIIAYIIFKLPASPWSKIIRLIPMIGIPMIYIINKWFADDLTVTAANAYPVNRNKYPYYVNCVESLSIGIGIPCPKIYMIDDPAPNAFSSGRDPVHGKICVTTGLLEMMNRQELEGVIAHELSHIRVGDTTLMTIVLAGVTILHAFTSLTHMGATPNIDAAFRRRGIWIGIGVFVSILVALGCAISIMAGVFILIVCMSIAAFFLLLIMLRVIAIYIIPSAIAREREFFADSNAALATRYPDGLIRALQKINASDKKLKHGSEVLSSILIASSGDGLGDGVGCMIIRKLFPMKLYALIPSLEERIQRLEMIRAKVILQPSDENVAEFDETADNILMNEEITKPIEE